MRPSSKLALLMLCLLLAVSLIAGCGSAATPTPTAAPKATAPAPAAPAKATEAAPAAKPTAAATTAPATPQAAKPLNPPVKVRVTTLGTISDSGIFIAYQKGYFKEEGLDVELNTFTSAADAYGPLATGQLEVAGVGPNSGFFNAIKRDIPIKIVADKGIVSPGKGFSAFVVRKDLVDSGAFKDFSDLKGKTIAHPGQGVGVDIDLDRILEKGKLTRKDVKITLMPFPNMNPAFGNKAVDAAIQNEPLVTVGVSQGLFTRFKGLDEIYPNHEIAVILYAPQFARDNSEAAKRFMVAYLRGVRDYNDAFDKNKNRAEIVNILTKTTSVKDPALYDKMVMAGINPDGYVNADSIAGDLDWYIANGYVKDKPDLKTVIDNQFVDYAIQRLGKYR